MTLRSRFALNRPGSRQFAIELQPGTNGTVRLMATGPAGMVEAEAPAPDPASLSSVEEEGPHERLAAARRIGHDLYATLFPAAVTELLLRSVQPNEQPLPIAVRVPEGPLAGIPWELTADPDDDRFLALSERTPLVQSSSRATTERVPATFNGPIRLVVIGAEPDSVPGLAEGIRNVAVTGADGVDANRALHLLFIASDRSEQTLPANAAVVVAHGSQAPTGGRIATIHLPGALPDEAAYRFLRELTKRLGAGDTISVALARARRALAEQDGVASLRWAEPRAVVTDPAARLIRLTAPLPSISAPGIIVSSTSWLKDALSGIAATLVFFLIGLLLYRTRISSSTTFSIDVLSPYSLYQSFKGIVLELSTYRDNFLLIAMGIAALLTVVCTVRWLRHKDDTEPQAGLLGRLQSPHLNMRLLTFSASATLLLAGAYAYQQYLWRVALPIPDGAIGFAITREAAAASFQEELADTLYAQGEADRIVIRQLPVRFDASDIEAARDLGERIGAKAVIIYREDRSADADARFTAYVVFTDPSFGVTIGAPPTALADPNQPIEAAESSDTPQVVQIREGIEIPAIRTDTLAELVDAAAGLIAYDDNRLREAITLLQQAEPDDLTAPNTGLVNFYLGDIFRLIDDRDGAEAALRRAINSYDARLEAGQTLTPQDHLLRVKSHLMAAFVSSTFDEDYEATIGELERAMEHAETLVEQAGGLDQPFTARLTVARMYTLMADSYRKLDDPEQHAVWEERAAAEVASLAAGAGEFGSNEYAQIARVRFELGDCVTAVADLEQARKLDPLDSSLLVQLGSVYAFQSGLEAGNEAWTAAHELDPNNTIVLENLATLEMWRALGIGHYFEPVYLERSEELYRELLVIDPASVFARQELADSAELRSQAAMLDSTAIQRGDYLSFDKGSVLWPGDPERQERARAALAVVIEQRRIIATELLPEDPEAQVLVAKAYAMRSSALYRGLQDAFMESGARTAELNRDGAQILADASEVQRWTELILAGDSGASRIERLEAWAARADMADYVWGWYAFYLQDQYTADRELEHFRQVVADGIAEADAGPIEDVDEISPIRNLYIKAMFLAYIDGDVATAEALSAKVQELSMREITTMQEATAKSFAFCWETRAYDAAVAALADGDVDTAQSEFDKALRINPNHLPSLLEAVGLALREEDLSRSLELATHTTTVHPTSPEAWSALGRVTFAMDDPAASEIAYQRLLEIAAGYPEQHQLATVLDALDALKEQTNAEPDQRERIPEIAPLFERALDAMPESFGKAFQYPQAYGELGRLSLYAGDRSGAERLLRRSLEIDPHHPNFQALLVLSVLAQGKAAESEITVAVAESRDPVWDSTEGSGLFGDSIYASLSPTAYLDRMASEAAALADAFPEMADRLTPFTDAITAERGLVDAAA